MHVLEGDERIDTGWKAFITEPWRNDLAWIVRWHPAYDRFGVATLLGDFLETLRRAQLGQRGRARPRGYQVDLCRNRSVNVGCVLDSLTPDKYRLSGVRDSSMSGGSGPPGARRYGTMVPMAFDDETVKYDHQVTPWTVGQLRAAMAGLPEDLPLAALVAEEAGSDLAAVQVVIGAGFGHGTDGDGEEFVDREFQICCEFPSGTYLRRADERRPGDEGDHQ